MGCGEGAPAPPCATRRPYSPDPKARDWYFIAEQPAPAPHLAHPEGCAALRTVLVTVPRVSRSCGNFPDEFDLHLQRSKGEREKGRCQYQTSHPFTTPRHGPCPLQFPAPIQTLWLWLCLIRAHPARALSRCTLDALVPHNQSNHHANSRST